MKKILLIIIGVSGIAASNAFAQSLKDRLKSKLEQKAENRAENEIDKTLDKVDGNNKKNKGTTPDATSKSEKTTGSSENDNRSENVHAIAKKYSKFDFVPGNNVMYAEDFSQETLGEFPAKWNTNGSGEIVALQNLPGKWLQLKKDTRYVSGLKMKLPQNLTVEFDLLADFEQTNGIPPYLSFVLFGNKVPGPSGELADYVPGVEVMIRLNVGKAAESDEMVLNTRDNDKQRYFNGEYIKNDVISSFNKTSSPVHCAMWIQKERIGIWLNENKILDIPKAIPQGFEFNQMRFDVTGQSSVSGFQYYVSNFRVAEGTPDTHSKLLTEGNWSTSGILFSVNSDKIAASSYGLLRSIAETLNENPTLKVKIIGHTDTDGDETKNLDLSRRRAASVKSVLTAEFKIAPERLETDGLGGTKPIADNKTAEGKSQNRRVEFIKMQN